MKREKKIWYSSKEAAEYLAIAPSEVQYLTTMTGKMLPQKCGQQLVFTERQLKHWKKKQEWLPAREDEIVLSTAAACTYLTERGVLSPQGVPFNNQSLHYAVTKRDRIFSVPMVGRTLVFPLTVLQQYVEQHQNPA